MTIISNGIKNKNRISSYEVQRRASPLIVSLVVVPPALVSPAFSIVHRPEDRMTSSQRIDQTRLDAILSSNFRGGHFSSCRASIGRYFALRKRIELRPGLPLTRIRQAMSCCPQSLWAGVCSAGLLLIALGDYPYAS